MTQETQKPQLNIPVAIHRCKLVPYENCSYLCRVNIKTKSYDNRVLLLK